MSVRLRLGARLSAAVVVVAVPVSMTGLSPTLVPTSGTVVPRVSASAHVSTAPIAPSVTALQRHYVRTLPPGQRPQVVADQTTIAGGLSLRTKADRHRKIAVSSSKGSHVWTASALAEHDLPSAAMRAYKNAAASINATDPGCHLPWTLLAGIGRVESDHGRYGGSVLGNDGVPRPAIVGVPLNGKGPVAAIHDTDNGAFDGDTVWDRAVGPMQFIPSTWQGAGRDGDGDGKRSPNDIDDASLAAAAYLCNGGRDLSDDTAEKSAVFGYNPSDYYVALVTAFARGYATGVFVIPSPDVAPGAGDGVDHAKAKAAKAKAKAKARSARAKVAKARAVARARAAAKARAARRHAQAVAQAAAAHSATRAPTKHKPSGTRTPAASSTPTSSGSTSVGATASPTPTPTPSASSSATPSASATPEPPKLVLTTVSGAFAGSGADWTLGGQALDFGAGRMGDPAARDYDGQNGIQTIGEELAGLAGKNITLQVKDGTGVVYLIDGKDYRGADGSFIAP